MNKRLLIIGLMTLMLIVMGGIATAVSPQINTSTTNPTGTAFSNENINGFCKASDSDTTNIGYQWKWIKDGTDTLYGQSFGTCEQDQANESNNCGGIDNGGYVFTDSSMQYFDPPYSNGFDGNWSSFTLFNVTSQGSGQYQTYYKPTYATNATIKAKFNSTHNSTIPIPSVCWDYLSDRLLIQFHVLNQTDHTHAFVYCMKSAISQQIMWADLQSEGFYEEMIIWDYGNSSDFTQNTTINLNNLSSTETSESEDWLFSCRAYDGISYSPWLNSSNVNIIDANITLSANQLLSNTTLTGTSFWYDNGTQITNPWYPVTGVYNITVNKTGYYNITEELNISLGQEENISIEGMYNMNFSTWLNSLPYNTSVLNGIGWLYHDDIGYNYTISSTATQPVSTPWIQGNWSYYFEAEIDGIAGYKKSTNGTEENYSMEYNATYYLQNDYLQVTFIYNNETPANTSGRIVFEDLLNYTTLFQDTSLISLQKSFPLGQVNVYFANATNWTQYYEYDNDWQTIYNETIQILENRDKDFYVKVIDSSGQSVQNVRIRTYHSDAALGTYEDAKLIGQRYTDSEGETYFLTDNDKPVLIAVSKDGYTAINRIIATQDRTTTEEDPYIIRLVETTSGYQNGIYVLHTPMYTNTTTIKVGIQTFNQDSVIINVNGINLTSLPNTLDMYLYTLTNGTHYTAGTPFYFYIYINGELHTTVYVKLETSMTTEILQGITFPKIAVVLAVLILTITISLLFRAEGVGFTTFTILGIIMVVMNTAFWLVATILAGYYGLKWIWKMIT